MLDPLDLALEKISESKRILEGVITSSENFDYPKAKEGLRALEKMLRELGKAQAKLQEARHRTASNVKVVDFKKHQAQR